ncbi:hypothetical protein B0H13DRAFT_2337881 [Mycena leptocephala]|nr:hypothetical protein B0H13DRAFT_2337881 [Mycena leptocephala]
MNPESELPYDAGHTTLNPRVPSPATDAEVLTLNFVCRRNSRSILNCTVVGSDGFTPYFHIMTCTNSHQTRTLFRSNEGRTIATVQWDSNGSAAYVDIHKRVGIERVSEWLSLSGDASCRVMGAYGKKYVFYMREMYNWDPSTVGAVPDLLARIEKEDHGVTLDITLAAVNCGLLEMATVATVVFQSGHRVN